MDGSRIGDNVGYAVCSFKNNVFSPPFCFKLEPLNTVLKAELFAIYFAACCALENGHKISIYTDSLSSIQILRSPNIKSDFVIKIKEKLSKAGGLVDLSRVKADAGNPGNETADRFAKLATERGEFKNIHIHKHLKQDLLNNCKLFWQDTGKRVKHFVPSPDLELLTLNKFLFCYYVCVWTWAFHFLFKSLSPL
ncbi:hypothetical protein AVEN_162563-1 [Araneus ventricosus]|uniref:RNase H type-1 domain-containing protein n=1 Tax=Araneus ventricosus TaxID=182803 RepID=A0A4Y2SHB3_ARAVE|nr:hypothetical protein AVEN_237888-1 [Araneus ventricosus]GBN86605.1 hypothetical protein AVEN_162563-1 [Araneus ventricosus]